jgi:radical SAM protein with 4Fe4S-binding SPASM domain
MILSRAELSAERLEAELRSLAERIEVPQLKDALRFPRFFQIETTRLCNARCPFCAVDQWDKSVPMMSDALWEKIAAELIEWRDWLRFVDLQRAGEPLLDRKIYRRVRQLKEGGIKHIALSTNISGLNDKNARALLEAGIDEVMLSIDAIDKEGYEKSRVGLNYEQVMENIRRYFRLRDEIRPDSQIRVRAVCVFDPDKEPDAVREWEDFWRPMKRPHDRIYMKRMHSWGNQVALDGAPSAEDEVLHPCIIPWSTMHITAMGTVALCPHDFDGKADLGDINTHSIAQVWCAQKLQEVRRLHSTGQREAIDFCRGCRTFDEEFSLERDKDNWRTVRKNTSKAESPPASIAG